MVWELYLALHLQIKLAKLEWGQTEDKAGLERSGERSALFCFP